MRSLVLAVLLCIPAASLLLGQADETIYPVEPSPGVKAAWGNVVVCAGTAYVPSKKFEQIKWFVRDSVYESNGEWDHILGEWVEGDSIFITKGYESSGWVIAHEMLHHALNGPPTGDPHPYIPFAFPCGLLEFQQKQGGIMGGEPLESARWPAMEVR